MEVRSHIHDPLENNLSNQLDLKKGRSSADKQHYSQRDWEFETGRGSFSKDVHVGVRVGEGRRRRGSEEI